MQETFHRGWQHALRHTARPCLGTLEHGWSLSATDALHFAVGFSERCRDLGKPIKIECHCRSRGKQACSGNEEAGQ